ncbi:NTP transferase domain-containing protein [Rhizobium binxianense]
MIFGDWPLSEAEGVVLAHAVKLPDIALAKGRVLTKADLERLGGAGVSSVIAARLEPGDLMEDEAAARLAAAIAPDHLSFSEAATGRVNVYSAVNGIFTADRAAVDRLNRIDPSITLACLADRAPVHSGSMVATFKIIPLAVPRSKIEEAVSILRRSTVFEVRPFTAHSVFLVATELPSLKSAVMDKTARILAQRLQPSGSILAGEERVPHKAEAVAAAIRTALQENGERPKLIVVFGASAVIDPADVIPEAIERAGGTVIRVGMPVDPGNLLVLGRIGEVPVIGAPGCARSPKENGFDWVMERILAGDMPTADDISGLGVGGLLMEIQTRPRPRDHVEQPAKRLSVAVVLLAAGKASRMGAGGPHKLLAEFDGIPLVRRSAESAAGSGAASVTVVTGFRHQEIAAALSGLAIGIVHNPDYESGMASSLIAGFSSAGARQADGVLVMLADMPHVTAGDIETLIAAFRRAGGQAIVRAVSQGKRGNPVILPQSLHDAIMRLEGDVGARHLIESSGMPVIDVDIGDAAHLDVDTPDAVVAAGGVLRN